MTKIAEGKVVSIHYTLTLADGRVVDSSSGGDPLAYLHGAGNLVPGLERQLSGREEGEQLEVEVQPREGYGEIDASGNHVLPRQAFPADAQIRPGMGFHAEDEQGNLMQMWVTGVSDEEVQVTSNHPLAGEVLNFAIEVVDVRDASPEEKDHGHPHGPGGHAH